MARPPEVIEKIREGMRRRWQDPAYRERAIPHCRVNAKRLPDVIARGGTPEAAHYRKLREVLGVIAAREALGIGQ